MTLKENVFSLNMGKTTSKQIWGFERAGIRHSKYFLLKRKQYFWEISLKIRNIICGIRRGFAR